MNKPCIEAKEEKHILLANAIDNIDIVGQYAYDILQRIQGGGCGVGETIEGIKTPSLQEVLDTSSNKIDIKMREIRATLDEIQSALFKEKKYE